MLSTYLRGLFLIHLLRMPVRAAGSLPVITSIDNAICIVNWQAVFKRWDWVTRYCNEMLLGTGESVQRMTGVQSIKPLILIVDDDRAMRMLLRRVMEQEGYRVAEAPDGARAVDAFRELRPDIVLMDGVMPVMDGFDACARLKSEPSGANTPYPDDHARR